MSRNKQLKLLTPKETIEKRILYLRGQKILLDHDLAELYGVPTKRLNEQAKRNRERFPKDFMFQLTAKEKQEVVANCDHLSKLKFSPRLPYAFTEYGALMLANVLHSRIAIQMSIQIIRIFIKLREIAASHAALLRKIDQLEKKYDKRFKIVFDALRTFMTPPKKSKAPIGFHP